MATDNDNPERGQYQDILRGEADHHDLRASCMTAPNRIRHKLNTEQAARACRAGATALESPTLANVSAKLAEVIANPDITLHCGRFSRVWWAQVRRGDEVLARAEATSAEAAIVALLWPERVTP